MFIFLQNKNHIFIILDFSQMAEAQSELLNFIIDLDDGDCPDVGLHVAAFQGKTETLRLQLQAPNIVHLINSRVRPFLASPLRLAATGMSSCVQCVAFLPSVFPELGPPLHPSSHPANQSSVVDC